MKLEKAKIFGKYNFYYLPDDKYVGQRIALEKYEPYETELILRQVKSGDIIVDVGANIGYYTILLADKVGKSGKVYAFEPDSTNFEILEKNIKANNLENVVVIKTAVGSKNETKTLYKSVENLGDHKLFNDQFLISNVETIQNPPVGKPTSSLKKGGSLKTETVKIIKLDDYLKNIKIDLMKIDTQGWEPEVFAGAKKTIEKDLPIIFFEYSPASYKLAKLSEMEMMSWLKKLYKKFWWIDEWLYIYKCLEKEKIDKICSTNKTGYADLWVKKEMSFGDYLNGFRDLKIKKWIKKIVFRL
ncbi:MAG: FkbM family methyltransferase [Candidatus Shapirobacteria bacterium]|jgi:FkbM family methyltransferase